MMLSVHHFMHIDKLNTMWTICAFSSTLHWIAYIPCNKHFLYGCTNLYKVLLITESEQRSMCAVCSECSLNLVAGQVFVGACSVGFFSDLYYQGTNVAGYIVFALIFQVELKECATLRVSTLCSIETTLCQLSCFESGHMHRWNRPYLVQLICTPSVVGRMTLRTYVTIVSITIMHNMQED